MVELIRQMLGFAQEINRFANSPMLRRHHQLALHAALARLGDHSQALGAQLQAGQESFHRQALTTHTTLAASVA